MIYANISLGENVNIDPSSTVNNVLLEDDVKIAKRCSIFGSEDHLLVIGKGSYVGMNSILNGFAAQIKIGHNVSIAQNVNMMVDSAPNASVVLQRIFPYEIAPITIGNHCWIGASSIIMPGVTLGDYCVVAANSMVKRSFPPYSIIGGTPAKLIRMMSAEEIKKINELSLIR